MTKEFKTSGSLRRADDLLRGIMALDVPDEVKEKLRDWFKSGVSEEEKYAALEGLFREMKENLHPDHDDYAHLQKMHDALGFSQEERVPKRKNKVVPLYRRVMIGSAVAVIAAAVLVLGGVYLRDNTVENVENVSRTVMSVLTADSVQKDITLMDGSTVTLKSGGTLMYADNFNENRHVSLKGEAYFSVARDEEHPFTIESDKLKITVLGTEFYVKALEDEAEVVLTSGKVELQVGEETVIMEPKEKAVVDMLNSSISVSEISEGGLLKVSGAGLAFHDKNLREALTITADYFGKVLLLEKGLDSGEAIYIDSPPNASLEDIMQSISFIAGTIEYRIEADTISVSSKK